jgi:hypothetical protein
MKPAPTQPQTEDPIVDDVTPSDMDITPPATPTKNGASPYFGSPSQVSSPYFSPQKKPPPTSPFSKFLKKPTSQNEESSTFTPQANVPQTPQPSLPKREDTPTAQKKSKSVDNGHSFLNAAWEQWKFDPNKPVDTEVYNRVSNVIVIN